MSDYLKLLPEILNKIESVHIEYMIVGSFASMIYSDPRLTHDLDLVIAIGPEQVSIFYNIFSIEQFYCPPLEVLQTESQRQGMLNLIHLTSGLKIDLIFKKNNDHAKSEFDRKKRIEFWPGFSPFVATAEDVIIKKLVYFKEGQSAKHISDIEGIIENQTLDIEYLNKWINYLNLSDIWMKYFDLKVG